MSKAGSIFSHVARHVSSVAGHPAAFLSAVALVVAWLISGPIFGFSDTWQLVINTGTTIITFLMVFLIQHSQNHDTLAIHAKLDELIRAVNEANDAAMDLENVDDDEIARQLAKYHRLAQSLGHREPADEEAAQASR